MPENGLRDLGKFEVDPDPGRAFDGKVFGDLEGGQNDKNGA